jgi:thiol-disulfide isomerase/thioredoxin
MHRSRRAVLLAAAALACAPGARAADRTTLPPIDDLRALAAESARTGAPVIVLFSTPGCPYCREVRQNYLVPRAVEQQRRVPQYIVREVDITSRRRIGALDGQILTEAQFADRHGVGMVPVVMAFDASWRPLGEPLVGLDRAGFYESYLERLVADALRLRAAR